MDPENHPVFQPIGLWQQKVISRAIVSFMTRVSTTAQGLATCGSIWKAGNQ